MIAIIAFVYYFNYDGIVALARQKGPRSIIAW